MLSLNNPPVELGNRPWFLFCRRTTRAIKKYGIQRIPGMKIDDLVIIVSAPGRGFMTVIAKLHRKTARIGKIIR